MQMTQARRSSRRVQSSKKKQPLKHGLRDLVLIFFCFAGLYLFISLLTYYPDSDPSWLRSGSVEEVKNKGGIVGALFADLFFFLFGYFAYLFPVMVGYMGWLIYQGRHHEIFAEPKSLVIPGIGFILTLSAGCGLALVHFRTESILLPTHAGGILGLWIGNGLVAIVDQLGATLILLAVFFTGVTLLTGLSWLKLMDTLGDHTLHSWLPVVKKYMSKQFWPWFLEHAKQWLQIVNHWLKIVFQKLHQWILAVYTRWQLRRAQWRKEREEYYVEAYLDEEEDDDYFIKDDHETAPPQSQASSKAMPEPKKMLSQVSIMQPELPLLPALSLLDPVPNRSTTAPNVKILSQQMTEAFAALQVEAEVNAVQPGPVLTRFEVSTITPINTNHLDELSEALAKVLNAPKVRVLENQPGVLGIEMPNSKRQTIYLSELLKTPEFQDNLSSLMVALGIDVHSQQVIIDLTRIPHILMAGCWNEEKTQAINTLIVSLLYKSTPEAVRFLLIDSTTQELSVYAELPHLLMPVISSMAQTPPALQWCVQEMNRRYRLMAAKGARNIEDYNHAQQLQQNQQVENAESNTSLFYIVVIINELAEIMETGMETQVEPSLTRLTQKARAAGIHIILATQHPTVNVITGLIKANIPTRLAFQVTKTSESRTILGQTGAETLLGQGDMLYMTAGTGMPVRVHGSFVSDFEVQKVVADLKARATPDYISV
jgi:S-DNA-T family DNA segregation ATPase FtsK/SpoIIIE